MKFIDDKNKKLTWWNRNYFYLGTLLFVSTCLLIYAFWGNSTPNISTNERIWYNINFNNLLQGCLNNLFHSNWQHVLLNMLCFAVCGLYIERKTGTGNFVLLTIAIVIFDAAFTSANAQSLAWIGASGVQYALYGYIIIDYIFSFQKAKRNKTNTILGAIILVLMYLSMCFNGGTTSFGFEFYPYDLIHNNGHYSPFLAGLIVGLIVQISQRKIISSATINFEKTTEERSKKGVRLVYSVGLVFVTALISLCCICCPIAACRTKFSVNILCNYENYSTTYNLQVQDSNNFSSLNSLYVDWAKNIVDVENKENYVCEISTDKKAQNKILGLRQNPVRFSLSNEFVALSRPTDFNFYIQIHKAYNVQNNKPDFAYEIEEQNTTLSEATSIYNLQGLYSAQKLIQEGGSYKFKIQLYSSYNIENLKVYNNGAELFIDEDGYYVVSDVTEDISITYNYQNS